MALTRSDRHLIIAVSAVLVVIGAGTFTFRALEGWSIISSLYFTVATITTVGYGDLHPTHDVSRLAAIILLLVGVTTVLSSLTIIGTRYIQHQERLLERRLRRISGHMPNLTRLRKSDKSTRSVRKR